LAALKHWNVRNDTIGEVSLIELPGENGQRSGVFSSTPGDRGFVTTGGLSQSPSSELIIFGTLSSAQSFYDALVEMIESPCAVVSQPWISNYPTVYSSISEYTTCYPISGGVEECIELFYNRKRRRAALGYVSPVAFEEHCPNPSTNKLPDS